MPGNEPVYLMNSDMRTLLRNTAILLLPFLLMIVVNETVRHGKSGFSYSFKGQSTINSSQKLKDRCTWECHINTRAHCAVNHVKWFKTYARNPHSSYYGLLNGLKKKDYELANIFLFVLLGPLAIWYLLIRSIGIQDQINRLRKSKNIPR
jgi:hypothetical protein